MSGSVSKLESYLDWFGLPEPQFLKYLEMHKVDACSYFSECFFINNHPNCTRDYKSPGFFSFFRSLLVRISEHSSLSVTINTSSNFLLLASNSSRNFAKSQYKQLFLNQEVLNLLKNTFGVSKS